MGDNNMSENKREVFRIIGIVFLIFVVFAAMNFLTRRLMDINNRIFEEYKGPILPLSTVSDTEGVTAERELELDFSAYEKVREYPETAVRKVKVQDSYLLRNTTDEEVTIKAVYPFAGRLEDAVETMPVISVNGEEIKTELQIGRAVYHHAKIHTANEDGESDNFYLMNTRGTYVKLLADETYMEAAFEEAPDMSQSVKVYRFKNLAYDGEVKDEMRPMVKVKYELDKEKTTIFTYGASIYGSEETMRYECYDLPMKGEAGYGEDTYMVVMGEDIENLELVYQDERGGELLEGVLIEVEEYESALEEIILQLVQENRDIQSEKDWIAGRITDEKMCDVFSQYMHDIGAMDGETLLSLADLFYIYSEPKVMYQVFELTIPAGENVKVTADFERAEGTAEYAKMECGSYDVVTTLGSNLAFTNQALSLRNSEYIEFVEGAAGEELENGATELELNMSEEGFEFLLVK